MGIVSEKYEMGGKNVNALLAKRKVSQGNAKALT